MTEPAEHDERYMWLALFVVLVGTFMAILDSSIVNVAIPKIMTIFSASTNQIEWVLTGYMLTMGIVIPLTGYLSDTFGSKKVYIFSLAMFTIGSALCGMSWSTGSLVAARVIQAIGGGMIMPVGMSMIFRIVPLEKRGMALGVWGIAAMAAPAIGPTLSGYIVQYLDWRLIFTVNIPVGVVGVTLAAIILKETPLMPHSKFDLWGAVTCAVGLFTLLLSLDKVNDLGWSSPYVIGLLTVSILSLTGFVFIELSHPEPLLDLRVLKKFSYTLSLLISTITTIGLFGGIFLMPLYMENLRGYTAMQTGVLLFPSALATALMMPISGRLFDKFGARWLTISGLSILTAGTYLLSKLTLDTPYSHIMLLMVLRGLGMGLSMMPVQTAGMNAIPPALIGRASALNNTIRQVNGSLGIAVLTTILSHRQTFHAARLNEIINPNSPLAAQTQAMLQGVLAQAGLNPLQAKMAVMAQIFGQIMKQSMASALDDTFLVAGLICLVGVPLSLLIRKTGAQAVPQGEKPMLTEM